MPEICWLASYPKSGNTWLRFVVTALLTGRNDFPPATHSMYADIDDFTPDVHYPDFDFTRYADRRRVFLKTHDPIEPGSEPRARRRSSIPPTASSAHAVYLVRNPLDIVASTWNHLRIDDLDSAPPFDQFFADFQSNGGHGSWTPEFGAWDYNVQSWTSTAENASRPAFPVLVIRYEDLVDRPEEGFREIATFLSLETSRQRIRQALESFSFARLRQQEDQLVRSGVFARKGAKAGHRFFNLGRSGTHATALTPAQGAAVRARFGPTMARFGY